MSSPSNPAIVLTLLGVLSLGPAAPIKVSAGPTDVAKAERVASGLDRPVFVTAPPGDTGRLFIVEQYSGKIKILNLTTGLIHTTPFVTVPNLSKGSEQGLLGLAFHPEYATNGYFYVNFTDISGTTNVVRYQVSATDPDVADGGSAMTVLTIGQPQGNHNGGWIGFGPDGFLYVATGDGGGSNDNGPGHTAGTGNAQDTTDNLLGKLLRIDVDSDDFPDPDRNYAIPPTNPFVGATGDDEIWAYGLRNPWRPSFDRLTGDLYIADVGQNAREELDFQSAASTGGENYAWRLREGKIATPGVGGPAPPGAIEPIYDYVHGSGPNQGNSVTGGYVYRGPVWPLQGRYFFADYVNARIWSIQHDGTDVTEFIDWTDALTPDVGTIESISSFGEDARGNLYIVDLGGEVFRIVPSCTLQILLTFEGATLTMNLTLGTDMPVVWDVWMISESLPFWIPLWSIPLPPFPTTTISIPIPEFPDLGFVSVLTTFHGPDGIICWDVDIVDTAPTE